MSTNPEQDHRDRIASWEWTEEEAEEAWHEAQASARMLGCVILLLALALAVLIPLVVTVAN